MGEFILYIFTVTFLLCTGLWLGIYVLVLSPGAISHRLFFLSVVNLSLIYLTMIIMQVSDSISTVWFFYKIATSLTYFFFYFILLFIIFLSRSYKFIKISHIILALCVAFTIITMMSCQYVIFSRSGSLLVISDIIKTTSQWINPAYYLLVLFLYAYILFPHIKSGRKRERLQYLIIISSLLISFIIMMAALLIMLIFHYVTYPIGIMPILFIIFITGCLYAIKRYRMLSITPELVSADILSNISESIILLSSEKKIITANTVTKTLLKNNLLEGKIFRNIMPDFKKLNKEIDDLLNNKLSDFSCRLYYIDIEKKHIPMDARFSIVKDRFNDTIGILVIAREIKEVVQLKSAYKITDREVEIIQSIIMGYSNPEIAKSLNISANTMKRHISNIYSKLAVNNKMQLLSLLKDFNLIPAQKAEKSLILHN
jgi:diguanylate cyclase